MFCLLLLVAGMAVAVRLGDVNSPIVGCMSIPSPVLSTTTTTATTTPTSSTPSASVTSVPQGEGKGEHLND